MSRSVQSDLKRTLRRWGWLPFVVGLILILDQASKSQIERAIPLGGSHIPFPALDPYFMLVHWGNTGTAFGLLQGLGGFFALIALVVIIAVLLFAKQLPVDNGGIRLSLALILGGAFGNQIDRLRVGHVTDFLLFQAPIGGRILQWPAFNVADTCIVCGVILLTFLLFRIEQWKDTGQPVEG